MSAPDAVSPAPVAEPAVARRALVTGASTGIGAATVRLLRAHGWQVVATARRAERLAALADETGCDWIAADLQKPEDVERLASQAQAAGPIDAVVNNAGGAIGVDPVAQGKPEEWLTMYERNVLGALRVSQAFLPAMRERGRVIEIAPGLVSTEEFSLNRLHGDAAAAARVYEGVAEPLVAEDIAECIVWALERPAHVNIDSLTVRPRAQASNTVIARD